MRPAEDETLAVAAKEEEKLTRKARLAEKPLTGPRQGCSRGCKSRKNRYVVRGVRWRGVARCGESVAWHSVSLGGVFVHEVQDISGSTRALEKMQTSTE